MTFELEPELEQWRLGDLEQDEEGAKKREHNYLVCGRRVL